MINNKRVAMIIPARGGSKRLKHKNIYPVLGKPMLAWTVDAAKASKYIDDIYVSSEDTEILQVAKDVGAVGIVRPVHLSEDHVFKMHPIVDAVQQLLDNKELPDPDIVVVAQANSPQMQASDLDAALDVFERYTRQEIFSVDKNLMQNAAFRILSKDAVFQKDLSTNCGVFVADYHDIHTKEDVDTVERLLQQAAQ